MLGALQIRHRVSWEASNGATVIIVDGLDGTTFELNKSVFQDGLGGV